MELPLRYPSTISVGEVSLRIAVPSLKLDRYLDELQSQIDATTQVQVEIDKIETKEQITKSTDLVLEGISTSIESFYDLNSDRKSMDDAVALVIARAKLVEVNSSCGRTILVVANIWILSKPPRMSRLPVVISREG